MSGGSTAPRDARVPALDGVRGLAILIVLINNVYPGSMSLRGFDAVVWHLSNFGYVGVDLFFVLSGFLITGILLDTKGGPRYFRSFYARRVLRIFPIYYGTLVVLYFVIPHFVHQQAATYADLRRFRWFEWLYLDNFGYVLRGPPPFNTVHFWSLAVEEQFYFLWPLIVFALDRERLIRLAAAVMGIAFLLRVWALADHWTVWAITMLTPLRVDPLAMGAIIALVQRGPDGLAPLARFVKPALVACGPLALVLIGWNEVVRAAPASTLMYSIGFTAVAIGFGAVIIESITTPAGSRVRRFFENPTMRFLGRYSYAMYIFHEFVLEGAQLVPWGRKPFPVLGSVVPVSIAVLALVLAVTVALAFASWHLYEKQFLKLKRVFPYGREVRQDRGISAPVAGAAQA